MEAKEIYAALEKQFPGKVRDFKGEVLEPYLTADGDSIVEVCRFLRDGAGLKFEVLSDLTALDWPKEEKIQVVYHLFSIAQKHGPVIIRMRTPDRAKPSHLPSLTPIWRSAELQEREVYDLYGIHFDGHPDLRRILMWDEFEDYPMRKDYVPPDDFEYEPTPHDEVLERARKHYADRPQVDGAEGITATG